MRKTEKRKTDESTTEERKKGKTTHGAVPDTDHYDDSDDSGASAASAATGSSTASFEQPRFFQDAPIHKTITCVTRAFSSLNDSPTYPASFTAANSAWNKSASFHIKALTMLQELGIKMSRDGLSLTIEQSQPIKAYLARLNTFITNLFLLHDGIIDSKPKRREDAFSHICKQFPSDPLQLEGSFFSFFHQASNEKIKPVYAVFGEFADAQFDNMVSRCKTLQGFAIEFEQKNAAAPSVTP